MSLPLYGALCQPEIQAALAKAQAEPERWSVFLVQESAEKRTASQNRLFRRLLTKFAQQNGHSVAYWHDLLVERFLGFEEVRTEDGYVRKVLPTTADLSVKEFSDFLTACLALAAEIHISL